MLNSLKRVQNISGGNYWGKESKDGVAQSLKEIFNGNFDYGCKPKSQRAVVEDAFEEQDLDYFGVETLKTNFN